jgi:CelD/BcsL family acetyltransferase involved in cellulose biosynthesis
VSVIAQDLDAGTTVAASPERAGDLVVAIARTRAAFDALEADWTQLYARAAAGRHMFQSYNWLWHWAEHYTTASTIFAIVTARRSGRLVLVLPLVIERTAGVRVLTAMGDPVSQYTDAVIAPDVDAGAVLREAFDALDAAGGFDIVRLAKVRADSPLDAALRTRRMRIVSTEEAPYATLAGHASYAEFEARFSSKLRKSRRRQLRRLEEVGPWEVVTQSGTPEAADAVHRAMALKRDWLHRRGLFSRAFADRRFDAFFAAVAASQNRPAGVSVSALRLNGVAVDLNICVTAKRHVGLHILAYDYAVEKLGAGNHHLDVALQRAFNAGIDVFDFLAPRHPYKMEWADGVVAVNDWAAARTWTGALYLNVYVAGLREGAKWLMRILPKSMAQPLARLLGAPAAHAGS